MFLFFVQCYILQNATDRNFHSVNQGSYNVGSLIYNPYQKQDHGIEDI